MQKVSPRRIQLRRTPGWRKPEGAIVVSRPSKYGNNAVLEKDDQGYTVRHRLSGMGVAHFPEPDARKFAVDVFKREIAKRLEEEPDFLEPLRGHDLCCWCRPDQMCHADVLLALANS